MIKRIKLLSTIVVCVVFFFMAAVFPLSGTPLMNTPKGEKKPFTVPKLDKKAKIDGVLDDDVWKRALKMELKYEVNPGENIQAPVKTHVYIYSTNNHLFVAFDARDPNPGTIRARVTDRDKMWNDDYVGIVLDTFNSTRKTFRFYSNPFGIQGDKVVPSGDGGNAWDAIWGSAGKITADGYMVEMSIPFSSLRFQGSKKAQIWGIDAVRYYPRNLPHEIGVFPRDRSNNCYMCQAVKVTGFVGAKPGKALEFDPTLSAVLNQEREDFPDGEMKKKDSKVDPGITARWSFTPNLTLSAAVNPDFSHVEADAAQLDINTPYALFYPEKRPFFLEGSSVFLGSFYAVYTRAIKEPEWGVKLTGKEGRSTIGFFSVRDNVTHLLFPSSQGTDLTTLDQGNLSTVLRYRHDIGASSTLGAFVTDREGEEYFNRVAGVDGDFKITKKDRLIFQWLGSQTKYPDSVVQDYYQEDGMFGGSAWVVYYQHATSKVVAYAQYASITSGFRTDVGFTDQADTKGGEAGVTYYWRRNPGHWFTMLSLGGTYFNDTDQDGNMLRKGGRATLSYYGPLQTYITASLNVGKRNFYGNEFDQNNVTFTARMRPSGRLYMALKGAFGDHIDYANIRKASRFKLNPILQYTLGRHMYIGADHVYERLTVGGERLYTANISNLRAVYQFNRRCFLRTILQYVDYDYNAGLYTYPRDPRFKHLFSQILFSYKLNPQTVLFLGYSDDYYGYRDMPITLNNRTFFLKIGYALVM